MSPRDTTKEGVRDIATEIVTKEEQESVNIGELLKQHGLGVFHVRPDTRDPMLESITGFPLKRAMTIVYKLPTRGARTLEIATAILHPSDDYTKKVGAKIAIDNFLAGKTVLVPRKYRRSSPVLSLREMFGY